MLAATPQAPSHLDVVGLIRHVLSSLIHGLWEVVTASPLAGVVLAVLVTVALCRSARQAMYSGWERDSVRLFSRADKAVILARAGHRCEHYFALFGRCKTTTGLQADHIHPWSKGGHTKLANGQALCQRHNREKRAAIPFNRQLRKMETRRGEYFPDGVDIAVRRRVLSAAMPPVTGPHNPRHRGDR